MSQVQIVADESVDFRIVVALREKGYTIYSVAEQKASIKDEEVLQIAVENNALLITEDKDFGELVFRMQLPHKGILLIRVLVRTSTQKIQFVVRTIVEHYDELFNSFSVLTDDKLRIKE